MDTTQYLKISLPLYDAINTFVKFFTKENPQLPKCIKRDELENVKGFVLPCERYGKFVFVKESDFRRIKPILVKANQRFLRQNCDNLLVLDALTVLERFQNN